MNGTVVIDGVTVTRDGRGTRYLGMDPNLSVRRARTEMKRLREAADRKLANGQGETVQRFDRAAIDSLLARARTFTTRPQPGYVGIAPSYAGRTPRDSSMDAWGGRKGSSNAATYVDANCLQLCLATMLQRKPEDVPDPEPFFGTADWWADYGVELDRKCGLRLEEFSRGICPLRGFWIAVLAGSESDHAVLCRDGIVYHDPASEQLNGQPTHRAEPEPARERAHLGRGMSDQTFFSNGFLIAGENDVRKEKAPEPVEAGGQVFPSAWHRDNYVADLRRGLEGCEARLASKALDDVRRRELEAEAEALKAELARLVMSLGSLPKRGPSSSPSVDTTGHGLSV